MSVLKCKIIMHCYVNIRDNILISMLLVLQSFACEWTADALSIPYQLQNFLQRITSLFPRRNYNNLFLKHTVNVMVRMRNRYYNISKWWLHIMYGKWLNTLEFLADLLENSSWYHSLTDDLEPLISVNLKIPKDTEEIKEIAHRVREFYFGDKPVSKETWPQLVDVCIKCITVMFLCQNIADFNEVSFYFSRYIATFLSTFGHAGVLRSNNQNPQLLFICTSFHSKDISEYSQTI